MADPILFSPSTGGFYLGALHGDAVPADVVRLTARRHADLMEAQAQGARIVVKNGKPVAQILDVMEIDQRATSLAAVKMEARRRIEAVAPIWRQLNDTRSPSDAGALRFARIDAIRSASAALEAIVQATADDALSSLSLADHPAWPEFD